jgi:hypothetical protein
MVKKINSDKVDFQLVENHAKRYEIVGRTTSAALLIWFLETIYRLDETDAQDAVCDRKHDAGIDAIVMNDNRQEIVLFQAKRREKLPATLGDTDLKQFVGSLAQFKSEASVKQLQAVTKNEELRRLIKDLDIAAKVKAGYRIRPIFLANVAANEDAYEYIKHASGVGAKIELWDLVRLSPVLKQLTREWFVDEKSTLKLNVGKVFWDGPTKNEPRLVYAAVKAKELVKLPGISDLRIFAQNVRLGLGNTRVNDEIVETVRNKKEHSQFITFHNGLTIVAKEMSVRGSSLRLKDFSVCNGCQSLLSFYDNRTKLTDDLSILIRVVRVGDDRKLPETIAYRTNNQNAISLRDLSSNDVTQMQLKSEFDDLFGKEITYTIKRGEQVNGEQLANEYAGRLLLALYVKEPWSAHQKYRIFGDLETKIFNYDIHAAHIRLAQLIAETAYEKIDGLTNKRMARYGLTLFVILYLVGEMLCLSEDGKKLLGNPLSILTTNKKPNMHQKPVLQGIAALIAFIITELNYYAKEHGDDAYDYKSEFKSPKALETLRNEVLKSYEKDIARSKASLFVLP